MPRATPDEPELPFPLPPLAVGDAVLWFKHQRSKSRALPPIPAIVRKIGPARVLIEPRTMFRDKATYWVPRASLRRARP